MAIARNSLTSGSSDTDATSYATASITPTASRLLIACYHSVNLTEGIDPTQPTLTGNGLTWTVVDSWVYRQFGDRYRLSVAAANTGGSPSTGTITFDHGAQTEEGASWSVFELNGTDVSNGVSQCFPQFVHSTLNAGGTSISLTLASAADSGNRPFLCMGGGMNEDITPRTNWTEIHQAGATSPNVLIETQERLDTFETTASATWTTAILYGGIAFEVKIAGAAGGGATDPFGMSGFFGG